MHPFLYMNSTILQELTGQLTYIDSALLSVNTLQ